MYSLKDLERLLHIKAQTLRNWEKALQPYQSMSYRPKIAAVILKKICSAGVTSLLKSQGYKLCELAEKTIIPFNPLFQIRKSEQELSEHIDLIMDNSDPAGISNDWRNCLTGFYTNTRWIR